MNDNSSQADSEEQEYQAPRGSNKPNAIYIIPSNTRNFALKEALNNHFGRRNMGKADYRTHMATIERKSEDELAQEGERDTKPAYLREHPFRITGSKIEQRPTLRGSSCIATSPKTCLLLPLYAC
jgi:hypothetical protein